MGQEAAVEAPTLSYLATMTLELRQPVILQDTPSGARWVVEAVTGTLTGGRVSGALDGAANADWFTVGPRQIGSIDARLRLRTDDGALLLLFYEGRVDLTAGPGPLYIAPRFEVDDERYRWLNAVQGIGKGRFADRSTLTYELYEVQ